MKRKENSFQNRTFAVLIAIIMILSLLIPMLQASAETVKQIHVKTAWEGLEDGATLPTADVDIYDMTTGEKVGSVKTSSDKDGFAEISDNSLDFTHEFEARVTNMPENWRLRFQDRAYDAFRNYPDGVSQTLEITLTFAGSNTDESCIPFGLTLFFPKAQTYPAGTNPVRDIKSIRILDENDSSFSYDLSNLNYSGDEGRPQILSATVNDFPNRETAAYTPKYYIDPSSVPGHTLGNSYAAKQSDGSWLIWADATPVRQGDRKVLLSLTFRNADGSSLDQLGFSAVLLKITDPETGETTSQTLTANQYNIFSGEIQISDPAKLRDMQFSLQAADSADAEEISKFSAPELYYFTLDSRITTLAFGSPSITTFVLDEQVEA